MARIFKSLLLILLGGSLTGFAQQQPATLESLFAAAQQAQASGDYALAASDYEQAANMRPDMPEVWANLGLMRHEIGDIPAAIEAFQKAIQTNPSLYVPNLFLGIDYAHSGKPLQAIPFLSKAEKMNSTDPQAPLALGRAYISARKYAAAVPELTRALNLNPKLGTAWFDLGIAQLDEVESDARTISEENKKSPFAGALYAESLVKQARFGEAVSLYKTLLDVQPQPPCMRSEIGFALIREHEEAGAAEAFAAERATHPECGLAFLGQARLALDNAETDKALVLLQKLWDRDRGFFACNAATVLEGLPDDRQSAFVAQLHGADGAALPAELRRSMLNAFNAPQQCALQDTAAKAVSDTRQTAEEYYAAGEFAACAHSLQSAGAPLSAAKLRLRAACSFFAGDNQGAVRAATTLRKIDPHSLEALYWSIQANERLAFDSLAHFQQIDPDSARNHVLLGDILQQLERYDDAQDEYRKALAIAPSDPAAMLGLASAFLSNRNPKGAMALAQSALASRPDDPELNLIVGQALLDLRDYAGAEPYLKKSLNAKPQMLPRVHALIGKAYAETGRTQEAIAELNLGAASDEDGAIQYLLARLYRQIGDVKDAQQALQRMQTIKKQREARGVKRIEDPDLTPLERTSAQAAAP